MSYSSLLKSVYIDPIYDSSKRRTEFRLLQGNGEVYTSNLRLLNVGVVYSGSNTYVYNLFAGAYSLISRISLLSGNEVLEEIRDFTKWATFKNINSTNDKNKSVNKYINKSLLGFEVEGGLTATTNPDYTSYYASKNTFTSANNAGQQNTSWLSLRAMFSLLKNTPYLDTNKLENLRVVIEYNTLSTVGTSDGVFDLNNDFNTSEPLLVCDEVMVKDNTIQQPDVIEYLPVELDSVVVPAVNATSNTGTKQQLRVRVNGFNNKTVNRLLIVNSPTVANLESDRWASVSQLNQVVQPVVNGKNIYPFEGINGYNRRLALMVDTWGELNTIDLMSSVGLGSCVSVNATSSFLTGTTDYTGISINNKIDSLDLEYERENVIDTSQTTQTSSRLNQALNLSLYGEVRKVLTVNNGIVKSSYI